MKKKIAKRNLVPLAPCSAMEPNVSGSMAEHGASGEMAKRKKTFFLLIAVVLLVGMGGCRKQAKGGAEGPPEESAKGGKAPDFTLKALDGEDVSLSDFAGEKVVLISFWATWCATCREEIPELNELHRKFGEDLVVLGVDVGEPAGRVKAFLADHPAEYRILLDESAELAQGKYHLYGVPTNIVVDREGIVIYREAGLPRNPVEYFEKLFKE